LRPSHSVASQSRLAHRRECLSGPSHPVMPLWSPTPRSRHFAHADFTFGMSTPVTGLIPWRLVLPIRPPASCVPAISSPSIAPAALLPCPRAENTCALFCGAPPNQSFLVESGQGGTTSLRGQQMPNTADPVTASRPTIAAVCSPRVEYRSWRHSINILAVIANAPVSAFRSEKRPSATGKGGARDQWQARKRGVKHQRNAEWCMTATASGVAKSAVGGPNLHLSRSA
jgi:hypothetical protein